MSRKRVRIKRFTCYERGKIFRTDVCLADFIVKGSPRRGREGKPVQKKYCVGTSLNKERKFRELNLKVS